jgi:hypothetical protein
MFPNHRLPEGILAEMPKNLNYGRDIVWFAMGIKIMMPPDVMERIAGTLLTKHLLGEIVRSTVKTPFDQHYFTVVLHKGVSNELPHMLIRDVAKILGCPTSTVHRHIAEHAVYGSARGGCRLCMQASKELKAQIMTHELKGRGRTETPSPALVMTFESVRSSGL